jgi:chemotaxis protein methyltransferase CheR
MPPEPSYAYLRQVVFSHSQNVLDPARDYLFDTRLARLVRNHGLGHIEGLVRYLRLSRDAALEAAIAEAMTINETSFFRDHRPFELLRSNLLPGLIESRRGARTLRFWSAACSTGQEALSLAMVLREHFPQLGHWDLRIECTDVCSEAVERARAGRYHRIEMNRGLPASYPGTYFDPLGDEWLTKPVIHDLCRFQRANLCASPLPFSGRFDLIFLRNVMLYFTPETRRHLLSAMHHLLAPDGFLFLGSSEQPAEGPLWAPVMAGGTCHYRPMPQEGSGTKTSTGAAKEENHRACGDNPPVVSWRTRG